MRKFTSLALAVSMCLGLSGCSGASIFSNYREIEDLEIIRTVGIDYEAEGICVTACTGLTGTDTAPRIYEKNAPSLAIALNELQRLPLGKSALLSHVENLLIGEEQARKGITMFLDYLERYSETRLGITPFIVRGESQEVIVGATGEATSCTDILGTIRENAAYVGAGCPYSCLDVATSLARRGCALIMAVEGVQREKLFDEQGDMDIQTAGFAIIEEGRLSGYLDEDETMGVLMVTENLRAAELDLESRGVKLTVMLTGCKAGFTPVFDGGELERLDVELTVSGNVVNLSEGGRLWEDSFIDDVEDAMAEKLLIPAAAALERSQSLGLDFMALGDAVEMRSPIDFSQMEKSWEEIFPGLEIEVQVNGELKRTYDINDPVRTDGGEEDSFWDRAIGSLTGS